MDNKKRKAQKVLDNLGDTNLAHLDATLELGDKIEEVKQAIENIPQMEMPTEMKVEITNTNRDLAGAFFSLLKGEKGDKGEKGENGVDGKDGLNGKDGKNGKDGLNGNDGKNGADGNDGKDGEDGKNGEDGKDGSPDTPVQVRDKLETLEGDERLDSKYIKGLESYSTKLETSANIDRAIGILDQRTQFLISKTTSSSSGGATAFTQLTDVPNSYAGQGGKAVRVNVAENALEFFAASGSGTVTSVATSGSITGGTITTTGTLSLVNDNATPGNSYYYGTNSSGTKGFFALPAGSGTVTSVASADGSITVTNPTTTVDLAVVSAPKWTTARSLAGNSVDGSANVAFANKFIVQGTSDSGLSGAQFLGALTTGILKNTSTTGVLSIAVAGDFPTLNQNTTGSAATLTTTRTIWGQNFNGSANVTGDITLGSSNITMTGSLAATGARVTKGWFTDLESTNMPTVGGTVILSSLTAPTFTTQSAGDNSTKVATTAYVDRAVTNASGVVDMWGMNDINSSIGNNTYTIVFYAEFAGTINEMKIISGSGTCTAALKINGTNVTGISAVSVSSSVATGTASGANTFAIGDKVTLVLSSTSSLTNLQATVKYTRT